MANIRVLIVDDVQQVRQDLHTFLSLTVGIEVIGEAANGLEAIRLAETLLPEVVLMDLEMPAVNGFEATRQIKAMQPACRVIALSIRAGEKELQQALKCGVDYFVVKGAPLENLVEVILNVPAQR